MKLKTYTVRMTKKQILAWMGSRHICPIQSAFRRMGIAVQYVGATGCYYRGNN